MKNKFSNQHSSLYGERENPELFAAIRTFYDRIVPYEWTRLDHYVLEYATVKHYLARYLPSPPARLLDIGGGPGRYAIFLAQQGYTVTLVDISEQNLHWAKRQCAHTGVQVEVQLVDAQELGPFPDASFDAVLSLGPLYHLPTLAARSRAVAEQRRVLRPGGKAFAMMLTRAAAIYEGFNRWPEGILDTAGVQQLMQTGQGFNFEQNPADFVSSQGVYFAQPSEIVPLHESHGFSTLALAACEGLLGGRREEVAKLKPEVQKAWIELMLQICEDKNILGAAERLLYVGEAI